QHWHYTYRQCHRNRQNQGQNHRRGRAQTIHTTELNLDNINELWSVSSDIILIASFLDPRFKNFEWCNSQ
ncbi:12235_t:CDS:2, partial [Funneliformis geosporum]